jgi:nitrogen fixation NifU-like protein
MGDLRDLYQEVILDHSRRPRNFRVLEGADRRAEGYNPLCGDRVTVYVRMEKGRVGEIGFQGSGCAISTASASMMTEALRGKSAEEAEALFRRFHEMLTGTSGSAAEDLGKLQAFSGVREFPIRVKCATLAWHAMRAALEKRTETVSTE